MQLHIANISEFLKSYFLFFFTTIEYVYPYRTTFRSCLTVFLTVRFFRDREKMGKTTLDLQNYPIYV